ncbi:hypothetical protein [Cytobacillus oceanisediminis]|uniref:hypothetical protein n=1 Tax=Cytobacillus oceanisediminis TaxID=665099 RepID=UPI00203DD010|nr:hypothetical protein [Cytobacillus oceanisediminis]MCM3405452.1 hypothetical protein [Cytobacillus oceanisediminis]
MSKNNRVGLEDILAKDKLEVSSYLIYRKEYRELSSDAKLMYQYLLKRFSLTEMKFSQAIEEDTLEDFTFIDDENNLFCFASNDELRFVLNISEKTVVKAKKELKEVELLEEAKQTAHKTNRLYLNKVPMDIKDKEQYQKDLSKFKRSEAEKRKLKNAKRKNKKDPSKEASEQQTIHNENNNNEPQNLQFNSEPQNLQFSEPQNLQFMNRKIYRQSTKEDLSTSEYLSTKEILNPNLIASLIETLWNTKLPHDLKTRIKIKIYNQELFLTSEQILLLEDAYNFQIEKGYIIPNCSKVDKSGINDYEFSLTIIKMLETVQEKIDNMKGLVQTWVLKAYEYKITNLYESPTKSLPNYNWLETENENSKAQNEDEDMPY